VTQVGRKDRLVLYQDEQKKELILKGTITTVVTFLLMRFDLSSKTGESAIALAIYKLNCFDSN